MTKYIISAAAAMRLHSLYAEIVPIVNIRRAREREDEKKANEARIQSFTRKMDAETAVRHARFPFGLRRNAIASAQAVLHMATVYHEYNKRMYSCGTFARNRADRMELSVDLLDWLKRAAAVADTIEIDPDTGLGEAVTEAMKIIELFTGKELDSISIKE